LKLPPVALTAPTLCPRCDTPALGSGALLALDHCAKCTLQLRQCGRCHGVAGPFDRYCGYCGYEIVRPRTSPEVLRLLLLAAAVPVALAVALVVVLMAHR
jgi:hypothetical protein